MSVTKPIPPNLRAQLDHLNAEVQDAIDRRTKWLDMHMAQVCRLQIGDAIYDVNTGEKVGTVTEHYRYWASQRPDFDFSLEVDVKFEMEGMPNCFGNTSCEPRRIFGTWQDCVTAADMRAAILREIAP